MVSLIESMYNTSAKFFPPLVRGVGQGVLNVASIAFAVAIANWASQKWEEKEALKAQRQYAVCQPCDSRFLATSTLTLASTVGLAAIVLNTPIPVVGAILACLLVTVLTLAVTNALVYRPSINEKEIVTPV